jgi:hypothetical protein
LRHELRDGLHLLAHIVAQQRTALIVRAQ